MASRDSSWATAMRKRARKNERLIRAATARLAGPTESGLAADRALGIHLGVIALANCSTKTADLLPRARWLLHWMIGYVLEQQFTVEEASTENALDALAALAVLAEQARTPHPRQLHVKLGVLIESDGRPVDATWAAVYMTAWQFINGLHNVL